MFISFIKIQILIQITQNHVVSFTFLTPLPILLQERPSCIISHPRAQSPLLYSDTMLLGFPRDSVVKTPPANEEPRVQSLSREDPWRRKWQPIPVYLPENPMERGAWWATFHGLAKSWTWLSRCGNTMRSYRICISQSNVFHLAKYPQGPHMLQMAGFYSLLWLNNILALHYIPHFLYSFNHHWLLRLLPCLRHCKYCWNERAGEVIKLVFLFSEVNTQHWNCGIIG